MFAEAFDSRLFHPTYKNNGRANPGDCKFLNNVLDVKCGLSFGLVWLLQAISLLAPETLFGMLLVALTIITLLRLSLC